MGPLLMPQTHSPSPETSRHKGNTAPQWHGCSTTHPSWSPSTGSTVESQECLHAPQRVKGWTPPTQHQDMSIATGEMNHPSIHEYYLWQSFLLLVLMSLASNDHERVHWWGALAPHIGIHTVGAASNSSVRAHHRGVQHRVWCIPRLPQGVPQGVSHLCQFCHTPSL